MPDYNPNSIWGSRNKKPAPAAAPAQPAASPAAPAAQNAPNAGPKANSTTAAGIPVGYSGPSQPSFIKRHGLLFFTLGIFLAIGLAALIYYLVLPPATPDVVISFSAPTSVMIGQPFPLAVNVSNDSKSVLENAVLNIELPSSFSFVGQAAGQQAVAVQIGTLSSGTITPPTPPIEIIATGNSAVAGTSQTINANVTYETAETASTEFINNANTSIAIGSQSALSLTYNAPSSIFSGQDFPVTVNYANNTTGTLSGVQLTMSYPPAYHYVSTSGTAPTGEQNNIWGLGDLAPQATGTLLINGNIVGPTSAQYQLTGTIGANFSGQVYPAVQAPVSFAVTPSPLSLTISANNPNNNSYVELGNNLTYTLTYTNNSNVTFQTVNISASLVGAMYDFTSLKTQGTFNSQSNTITWYTANTPGLASLAPGQTGSVTFSINVKQNFPIKLPSDKDYALNVTAEATSPTVPANTAGTNTTSITALTTKVGGEITLGAEDFYKEASSTIKNTGPYPPKVNQATEYTVHWTISNYSTDAQNITVSAYLQSGSTFTGAATSTGLASNTLPTYNAGTGLVTWTIPYIPATTGVISPPVQAVFQITNTPSINQVGQQIPIIGQATLTATDVYTSSTVQASAQQLTTSLPDDPSVNGQLGVVTQ